MGKKLVFLKLGGSLITDKNTPRTARIEVIQRIGKEIKIRPGAGSNPTDPLGTWVRFFWAFFREKI